MKKLHIIIVLACLFSLPAAAWTGFSKEKKINDHFTMGKDTKLRIQNEYGYVRINTWDRDDVTIDITISVKATSDRNAEDIINSITIEQNKANDRYSYKTQVRRKKGAFAFTIDKAIDKSSMEINYVVHMPADGYLELTNKFGDVFLADYSGSLFADVSYGAIKTQKLKGERISIKSSFGSIVIPSIEIGSIESRYSKITIDKAQKLTLGNRFGKLNIGNADKLYLNQEYGDATLGTIAQLKGNISFAGFSMDKVTEMADVTMRYCSKANFGTVGGGVDAIKVQAHFSSISFQLDNTTSLTADIQTRFGGVNYRNSSNTFVLQESDSEDRNTNTYTGKIGSGKGHMVIQSEYGNITFR